MEVLMCRACLSSDKNVIPFNETFINYYNLLTNLDIKPLDGLPQSACETCVKAVNNFVDFREQCIQSECSLQQELLKNIKIEPDLVKNDEINENISKSTSENRFHRYSKDASLPKRPRGRPRKAATESRTTNKRVGFPRKNETKIPEVQKKDNPLKEFEIYANSVELSLIQQNQSCDLDVVKEEIKYEYIEDNSIDFDSNFKDLATDTSINEILVKEDKPHGKSKKLQTSKNSLKVLDNVAKEQFLVKKADLPKQVRKRKTIKTTVVNEINFPCGLCEKRFETQQAVSCHLENHKNDSDCETCHATFAEWPALLAHRIEHVHSKYHQCHICPKRVFSVETFEYHYLLKHCDKKDIKLSCKLCAKTFTTAKKLQKHKVNVHGERKYVCDHCSKAYSTRGSLKTHLQEHSGEVKKYVCGTCGFTSKHSTNLKAHIVRIHTATRVNCKGCRRVFPTEDLLQQHKCPGGEKICSVCGKIFKTPDHLRRHMDSHSDVCKFKCELCPAAFKTRGNLVNHANRHKGYRPHACPHCPQRFYAVQHLIRHNRIHTGERPYACKECSKAFYNNHSLKLHMKVHGEYLIVHQNKQLDNQNDV